MEDAQLYINKINEYFEQNSFDAIDVDGTDLLLELPVYLNKLKLQFYDCINLSLLSGEYLMYESDFNSSFEHIQNKFKSLRSIQFQLTEDAQTIISNTIDECIYCVKEYLNFVEHVRNKYSDSPKTYIFNAKKQYFIESDNYSLFQLNLEISKLDNKLTADFDTFSELLFYKTQLEKLQAVTIEINEILVEKCSFLIEKVYRSIEKEKENENFYFIDQQETKIYDPNKKASFKYINEISEKTFFKNQTDGHTKHLFDARREAINKKHETQEKLSFDDYHILVKDAKDERGSLESISDLIIEFERAYQNLTTIQGFDKKAYAISYNYLCNHKTSLIAAKNDSLDLEKELEAVIKLQQDTKIKSYFPFLKIAEAYKSIIENEISNANKKDDFNKAEKHINAFQQVLKKLDESYSWSIKNLHWDFQPPLNESIITIKVAEKEVKILVFSSFIGIINYSTVEKKRADLKESLQKFSFIKETFHQKLAIQEALEEAQKAKLDAEQSQKKTVEILAIFSAIVLYASGSIQIFSKIDSLNQALLFMLTFAAGLSTFILLILLIVQPTEKIKISFNKGFIACILICMLIISTWLLVKRPSNHNADSTIISTVEKSVVITQKDSVSQSDSIRTDSLKQRTKTP
jgi:hypothetical protein